MSATFADRPIIKHGDGIGPANGGKTVSDYENSAAGHEIVQSILNEQFRFGVELGSRFVQNEDGSVLQQGAGNREALALAAGKALAAIADQGPITVRHLHDEIMREGGLSGGNDFFLGYGRAAITQVVPNRVIEEDGFLRDDGHLLAEGAKSDIAQVDAVNADLARSWGIEAGKKIYQGRLSRSARTDKATTSPAETRRSIPLRIRGRLEAKLASSNSMKFAKRGST